MWYGNAKHVIPTFSKTCTISNTAIQCLKDTDVLAYMGGQNLSYIIYYLLPFEGWLGWKVWGEERPGWRWQGKESWVESVMIPYF